VRFSPSNASKHKKQFLSVIFISIMIQLIMLLTPLLFQYFLDSALPSFNLTILQTIMLAMRNITEKNTTTKIKSITRVSEFPVMKCLIFAISRIKAVIFPI
jgi:ABC-type protease/lipase transport system fused ATPase/permease subunit